MAIYVTGDTHGSQQHGLFSVDGFMTRFNTNGFPEQKELTKDDYIIVCGDFGGVWASNNNKVEENPEEKNALDWLDKKPFTTLFVPGNHENYDRLTGCHDEKLLSCWLYNKMPEEEKEKLRRGYPQAEWHGGKVRVLRDSVLMLERGYIFDIDGKSCFAFGGARSHDISDGILNPYDYPDNDSFSRDYRRRASGFIRVNGISWWPAEMPSKEEMQRGKDVLKAFTDDGGRIDYVFTHDAPASDKIYLGYMETDELNKYLESLMPYVKDAKWFYGHLHDNRRVFENHYLLYEQIVRVC